MWWGCATSQVRKSFCVLDERRNLFLKVSWAVNLGLARNLDQWNLVNTSGRVALSVALKHGTFADFCNACCSVFQQGPGEQAVTPSCTVCAVYVLGVVTMCNIARQLSFQ